MEQFKAIVKFSELCELIKEGATLSKSYGVRNYTYSLHLSESQQLKYGFKYSMVSKTIGYKFSNQSNKIIEIKTLLAGNSYEITYKK